MPKKAKSGKKGKLAKMTEEERILYLEQKLLAEEEMRRKKEEMLTQYLKDRLSKEEKNTKFNMAKLQNQWRVIMREMKSVELKKDIEILSQTFERIIDRKDAILKSLVKDLEEAEEQYQTAIKSHLQNLRRLLGGSKGIIGKKKRVKTVSPVDICLKYYFENRNEEEFVKHLHRDGVYFGFPCWIFCGTRPRRHRT